MPQLKMFTIFPLPAIVGIVLLCTSQVFANDSTARLGAGGIELLKNEHIRMLEEVLEISPTKVRVKYRFLNESDQDTHTTVAFPVSPEDPILGYHSPVAFSSNILKTFKVLVNGRLLTTQHERKAVVDGRDITAELRKLGLSDKEIFFEVSYENLDPLLEKLRKPREEFGDWSISHTLYWEMTFPTHKETIVEHEYEPGAGGGWTIPYQGGAKEEFKKSVANLWSSFSGKLEEREDEDCLDEATKRAVENRVKVAVAEGANSVSVSYVSIEYILGTGRNWKGPIGEFKLRLIKEKPDQFVSVCFPGRPEKISPTTYEFVQKDFVPPDKLVVYFYTVDGEVK
ncbi:MAG: DUF4424 family protein [Desulfomonile tiedjei]|nr:DUF4424 family protein [Desulfomonile tiedjei]